MKNDLFETAPIPKAYFTLALPVVFSMAVSLIYNMVDTFFIARTQNTNLVAAVSLCAPVFTLMLALGDIFGLGGSSVISRLFGEKRDELGKRVSGFCFYAALVCGFAVTLVMLVFRTPILHLLGATHDTYAYASQYYTYMALGAPVMIVSLTPSNIIRTEGLAVESMIGTITGSVVNIILDPVFIFALDMGAGGAAIATVLGNLAADILLVLFVIKRSRKLTVSWKNIRVGMPEIKGILAIGIPASLTNLMQSLSITLTNRSLVSYGTDKVAAMGITMKVNMIVMLIMVGFAFGAQPLVGYNYGAQNTARLKKIIRFDIAVEVVFAVTVSCILALGAPWMIRIFMDDAGIVRVGALMLRCLLVSTPLAGMILVYTTVFQAAGKAFPAFLLSLCRQGIVFAVCILLLSRLAGYYGVICAQAGADVITVGIAVWLYKRAGIETI